jgi:hypothetical protein
VVAADNRGFLVMLQANGHRKVAQFSPHHESPQCPTARAIMTLLSPSDFMLVAAGIPANPAAHD